MKQKIQYNQKHYFYITSSDLDLICHVLPMFRVDNMDFIPSNPYVHNATICPNSPRPRIEIVKSPSRCPWPDISSMQPITSPKTFN